MGLDQSDKKAKSASSGLGQQVRQGGMKVHPVRSGTFAMPKIQEHAADTVKQGSKQGTSPASSRLRAIMKSRNTQGREAAGPQALGEACRCMPRFVGEVAVACG